MNSLSGKELLLQLEHLALNGIQVEKNLRQPTYYSRIDSSELKPELFSILADMLSTANLPIWLSQQIAWSFVKNSVNLKQIKQEQTLLDNSDHIEYYLREKLVVHVRENLKTIVREWLDRHDDLNLLCRSKSNEQLRYDEFDIKNRRRLMEDRVALYENLEMFNHKSNGKHTVSLFGVFDGHCGTEAAQYVSVHLPFYLVDHDEFFSAVENQATNKLDEILLQSFNAVNTTFLKKAKNENIKSGTTCCICLISGTKEASTKKLSIAWCGDSQACLTMSNGSIEFMTVGHKPEDRVERERIESLGARVINVSDAWRINGVLSVARSFGDIDYQPYVICTPQVKHLDLDMNKPWHLIIGCDGLWDSSSAADMSQFVVAQLKSTSHDHNNINMAEQLVKKSRDQGSSDNITAIFISSS